MCRTWIGHETNAGNRIPFALRHAGSVTRHEQAGARPEAPRGRTSELVAAMLRISASLDLDTVLAEVVAGARALTGARYGVIVTADEAGEFQDYVASGFTAEEEERMIAWPDGLTLVDHFRGLAGPLRLDDLSGYVLSLGFEPAPIFSRTFQGTPLRHRGVHVGHFFLAEKTGGGAFTVEDEELLALFASQAATAVVNARIHRDERRARADLEALVQTTPVGVVVFAGKDGRPVKFNREVWRIVESLRTPGQPREELLDIVTCRRADGREVSLSEYPLAVQFAKGETVRAEELVLSVPDGRSVRVLVNATPIQSADGAVESVVVAMQDLAPLDEIERLRAEFLALVSHELRQPLSSIKGSAVTLLEDGANLDRAEMREFHRIVAEQADRMRGLIGDLLDVGAIDSGTLSVAPEASDLAALVDRARNDFLSAGARHTVLIDLPPDLPRVMAERRRIVQVLNNLLSNSARNAPESSSIRVSAERDGSHVAIAVADDGRGIAAELLPRLFSKHTGDSATMGYGLGLAICKGLVEAHGGRIRAESAGEDNGATIRFTLPVAETADGRADVAAEDVSTLPGEVPEPERILVVDDDPRTLRFVRNALDAAGYATLVTGDGQDMAQLLRTQKPRLVLMDLVLPGLDGIELMQQVPELAKVPVIFISGYGRDETIVRALEAGAADYIVKPFSPTELVARIRAALRQREGSEPYTLGELSVDYGRRRARLAGRELDLTATEFDLLHILAVSAGRVVTYETLLDKVWTGRAHANSNLVRIFVRNLREKLGDSASNPDWIFNQRGVGYRLARPGSGGRRPEGTVIASEI